MTAKTAILEFVQKLPDDSSWDEIEEQVHLLRKVQEGEEAIRNGQTCSHEEAQAYLRKCLGK
ncbi:MAG: hypothetical protein U0931_16645 [Vulcanimicrobiota bacterium]